MQSTLATKRVSRRALALLIVGLVALAIVAGLLVGGVGRWRAPACDRVQVTNGGPTEHAAMATDGSDVTALTDGLDACCPSWTPNGSRLLFGATGTGHDEIYVMRVPTAHTRPG